MVYLPASFGWASHIGQGRFWRVPIPIHLAVALAGVAWLFLRFTKPGWNVANIGDKLPVARISGIPARSMPVAKYMLAGVAACVAGLIAATAAPSMNTRIVNANMIYAVILIVVLGGVAAASGGGIG